MDEIKWVFDMCGFVLFPSLLSDDDTAQMLAEVEETLAYRQAAGGGLPDGQHMSPGVQRRIPATHEQVNPGTVEQPGYLNYLNYGGRCGELLDHPLLNVRIASASQLHVPSPPPSPALARTRAHLLHSCKARLLNSFATYLEDQTLLNELLGDGREMNDDCYNFRCDDMMTTIRRPGKTADGSSASNKAWVSAPSPHNVPPGHGLRYHSGSGRINAGIAFHRCQ